MSLRHLLLTGVVVLVATACEPSEVANQARPAEAPSSAEQNDILPERAGEAEEANVTEEVKAPVEDSALASMSPYRRREYERGYRDCANGQYDRERQGESYRLGCMAAENAKSGSQP